MHTTGDTKQPAASSGKSAWYLRPKFLFVFFSAVNFLNFLDRGIIPGATSEFNAFIESDLSTDAPDAFLGLLQSSFIVGLAIGSVVFGHLIHRFGRFYLTAVGCGIWTAAVVCSGLAAPSGANSYAFLIFSRMLSGAGEASLQVAVPPWIQHSAAPSERSTYLALFYTAVPVGTAAGYAYSSLIASSSGALGWQWAFYFEAMAMLPMIAFMLLVAPHYPCEHSHTADVATTTTAAVDSNDRLHHRQGNAESVSADCSSSNNSRRGSRTSQLSLEIEHTTFTQQQQQQQQQHSKRIDNTDNIIAAATAAPTFTEELRIVTSRPIFLAVQFGYAAQTAMLIGLSTFGSAFLMGLGYFDSEQQASTVFGLLISATGVVATPLGGVLLDRGIAREKKRRGIRKGLLVLDCAIENGNDNSNRIDDDVVDCESSSSMLQKQLLQKEERQQYSPLPTDERELDIVTAVDLKSNHLQKEEDSEEEDTEEEEEEEDEDPVIRALKMRTAFRIMTVFNAAGAAALCLLFFVRDRVGFLLLIAFGCGCIFLSIPATNVATMLAVPTQNQSFAIALGIVILHLFGDVPAPVIVGLLKDKLAPNCVASSSSSGDINDDDADVATSSDCRSDGAGLRLCMLLVSCWLVWCVLLFVLARWLQITAPTLLLPCCTPFAAATAADSSTAAANSIRGSRGECDHKSDSLNA